MAAGIARRALRGVASCLLTGALAALILLPSCSRKMMNRQDAVFFENHGDQLYEKGDFEAALKEYNRALELGSQKLKIYNNIGNVYFRRGQYEMAEKYYRMALKIDPSYLFALNNLALTLYGQRNLEQAKAVLQETLKLSAGSALLYNTLGQILIKEGDLALGISYLKKAVEVNPDYAIALNNLGDVYLKNPQLGEDPLPFIMRAIARDPGNMFFFDTLGWYYCQIGVFDEALVALGKAFVQDPENAEIRAHYATVLEWLGKDKEAMEQWQAVMAMPADKELVDLAGRHFWEIKGR